MFLQNRQTRSNTTSLVSGWVFGVCCIYQMNGQVMNELTSQADDKWLAYLLSD